MSFGARLATALLVLAGTVLPLIGTVLSGVTAKQALTGAVSPYKVNQRVWTVTALTTVGVGCSLALILLVMHPLGNWAYATGICVFIAVVAGGINLSTAYERLTEYEKRGQDANVRNITSARSANS